ncbi:protein MEI2-like 7 [Nicotiana sylvestris]|uniref:Protein MEI2-like 7 n=1 Tax=Nicotiana sylvestris TaxID=4096 RepID=A0A1U7W6Q0_NICSY|nr:PREDICTED: protein MEI2-like 7 [Nicotiana sylvestris]
MAVSCTKTKLNPKANEWKPEKNLVLCYPPHEIYHPPPPQGKNELVVYNPATSQPQPSSPHFFFYQQHVPSPLIKAPFYWFYTCHVDFQPPEESCLAKEMFTAVGMKNGTRASFFRPRADHKRGQKQPFLPPRLRAAETERGRFGMKKRRNNTDGVYKSPAPKENPSFSCDKTTVMIRNIPNQFSREPFMRFIDHFCRENHWEYDFLYLPIDFGTENNLGYAFVNFTTRFAASGIGEVLKNFKWDGIKTPMGIFASKKICEVTWARIQGKEELVKHFSTSKFICDTDEYLPVVFSPPRNGSTSLTNPVAIGKLAGSSVSPSPSS